MGELRNEGEERADFGSGEAGRVEMGGVGQLGDGGEGEGEDRGFRGVGDLVEVEGDD